MVRVLYTNSNNKTHELNIEPGSKIPVVPGAKYALPDHDITINNVTRSANDLKIQLDNNQTIKLKDFFSTTTDTPTLLSLATATNEPQQYITSQELFSITPPDSSAIIGSEFVINVFPKIPSDAKLNISPHPQQAEQMHWLNAAKSEENYVLKGKPSNDNMGQFLLMITGSYEDSGANLFYMQTLPLFITSDFSSSFSFSAQPPETSEIFAKRSTQIQYSMFLAIPIFLGASKGDAFGFKGQFVADPTITGKQTQLDIKGIEDIVETSLKTPIIKLELPRFQKEEADVESTAFGQRAPLTFIEFGLANIALGTQIEGPVIEIIRPESETPLLPDAPFSVIESFIDSGDVSAIESTAGPLNIIIGFIGELQVGDFITIGVNFDPGNTEANDFAMPFTGALTMAVANQPGVELNNNDVTFNGGPQNVTQISLDLMIVGDNLVEGTETFSITYSLVDASPNVIIPADIELPVIGGTIGDDDIATFDISVDEIIINEEAVLPTTANFSISLSNPVEAGNEASVIISSGGSATLGIDFNPDVFTAIANAAAVTPGVNFNAGTGELTFLSTAPAIFMFAIDAVDDPFPEATVDTVSVTLSNAQVLQGMAGIANPTSIITITDTDLPAGISFISNTPTIPEGPATSASFTLGFSGTLPTGETLTIGQDLAFTSAIANDFGSYSQALLNAVAGQPGVALVGTDVVFTGGPGNVNSINILLPIVDDNLVEGTETINLGITGVSTSDPTFPIMIGSVSPSVDIIDNDSAIFSISADQTFIGEEANPIVVPGPIPTTVNFTISLSNGFEFEPAQSPIPNFASVFVSTSGDAIPGVDFTPNVFTAIQNAVSGIPEITFNTTTGELSFFTGPTLNFSFAINSVNDSFFEGAPDALNVTLSNPSVLLGTTGLGNANSTVSIGDFDPFPGTITLPGGGTVFDQLTVAIDQSLVGDAGPNTLNGFGGNDTLESLGGNDILVHDVLDITRVDGGTGFDTLQVQGSGNNVNLLTTDDEVHKNIEDIDISGSGANTLTLGLHDVLAITDGNNELFITGDADDAVNLQNGINPWQLVPLPANPGFSTYTADGATLFIDDDVNLTIF